MPELHLSRFIDHFELQARLDGGYATPEIFEYLEQARIGCVIAMAKNAVLNEIAEPLMEKARWDSYYSGNTQGRSGSTSWQRAKRQLALPGDQPAKHTSQRV